MTNETELVLDRRRMRRSTLFWRSLAIIGVAAAIGFAMASSPAFKSAIGQHQIARVAIEGTITENRKQLKMLRKIKDSDHVKALLLYVNSPGGTTTGGEAIYEELRRIAEKKPVVAQFGTVAASAGYIVGLGTDHIVSRGNTITGSVGVIIQWPEVTGLLDKIGVKVNEVKSGTLKAEPSPFKELDEDGRRVTKEMIASSFKWFVGLVEERRGISAESIPGLLEGRIFSGRDAVRLKLVDEIGGEAEAVKWLQTERGIGKDLEIVDWKPQQADSFGLSSSLASLTTAALPDQVRSFMSLVSRDRSIATLGLDGLVSVWHPAEN